MNKAELISKLQNLEGLTVEERSNLIGLLRQHKKYGLVWEDKPEDVEERLREELPVLCEVKDKAILSDAPDAPNHILIEGDNLEALTALSYTHEGKIDVIYIDPPYNTGNKDFVYNDSFVDTEDSYRHSKWLSFMNKRLKIAKKLLSDKGVIFISIDDNEQAQLKLLCHEIFGEKNFQGHIHWRRRHNQPNDKTKMIGLVAEHILVYSKDAVALKEFGVGKIPLTATFTNPDNDPRGPWASKPWKTGSDQGGSTYTIVSPKGDVFRDEWMGDENTFDQLLEDKRIYFPNNGHGFPRKKYYQSEREEEGQCACNWWPHEQFGHNQGANDLLTAIFGEKNKFSNPKPIELVSRLIKIANIAKNNRILDFFAGSGTTLHATMQLNAEDGGHRQCILVTNNENNICEEVTYERNKRVINGYTTPKGVEVAGLKANTLRYYKTDYISRDRTQKNMRDLVAAATDLLCIKEDLYEEQKTFGRFKLKPQLARYFNNGKAHMLIIYREELIDEITAEIKTMDFGKMRLKIYVFSPGRYPFTDNFREVEDKVELVALPAAIYDAYQKVLPKRKEKLFEEEEEQVETKIPADLFEGQGAL
ncbi:MAG: site-specific DNA-methyltransferase [Prevotella sp.]|nr:site-specific DNA-methyltransferase [Prevotella sp.]